MGYRPFFIIRNANWVGSIEDSLIEEKVNNIRSFGNKILLNSF